jgi:hypothetical protein
MSLKFGSGYLNIRVICYECHKNPYRKSCTLYKHLNECLPIPAAVWPKA